jgi:hypothetical protein
LDKLTIDTTTGTKDTIETGKMMDSQTVCGKRLRGQDERGSRQAKKRAAKVRKKIINVLKGTADAHEGPFEDQEQDGAVGVPWIVPGTVEEYFGF